LKRPRRSGFAAGAWVFPGGVVDPDDALLPGSPAEAAFWAGRLRLQDPREAWGYVAAGVRETWEETGILLGGHEVPRKRVDALRTKLLAQEISFSGALDALRVELPAESMIYIAHWITPEREPRRYDTRFFVASVPGAAEPALLGEELVEFRWLAPARAIAGHETEELIMLPPTLHTLRRMTGFPTLPALLEALREQPVRTILPEMTLDPRGVTIHVDEPEDG
jgi:8-oxo-dGTP pyrophosphatase MutT (NUDIX family)